MRHSSTSTCSLTQLKDGATHLRTPSKPHGRCPIRELLSQSSACTREPVLGRVTGRLQRARQLGEVTLVAAAGAGGLHAGGLHAGVPAAQRCTPTPAAAAPCDCAPAGAAARSGLLFREECFHLAYIKRIHFAVTRQARGCAGASVPSAAAALQLGRARQRWHTQPSAPQGAAITSPSHPSTHTPAERLQQPTGEMLSTS